ncbi:MAG: DUF2931 family protein [Chryseobacterium sp.]|jgi:hypothetical protein|uniref:DUF2931 family protein n=1 Tax=Chryseobacterium sp. TaxID=1871047 RepID=UPI00283443FC|nr:DUF2931 family protein [Chryseobacterium sp.]MDR2236455.1 DUF2931 family protein [Chryseobacterium sp.]
MDDKKMAFQVEISQPDNRYQVTPVFDKIKTLEGTRAGLPYGSSSGNWGDSGSSWTEQYGTPIGADITYYADYENKYYHLDIDFSVDIIKDYMERAYSRREDQQGETQEYKRLGRGFESGGGEAYDSFTTLVFGFAPKGMVVVWLNFGNTRIELGRYQAQPVTDPAEITRAKEKYLTMYRITPKRYEESQKEYFIADASPKEWDDYRQRYHWRPVVISSNPKFRLFEILNYTYNGEKEGALRPWALDMPYKERAIPREMVFFWETGKEKHEQLNARAFFDWEKTNEAFKKAGNKIEMQVKIASDNNSIEILLNGKPLETDSIRIYQWSGEYKESYR